ncbi:MAG TPA: DNA primase [Dehalococcoidia bacterium]|nr:DNA primase [Dehalococcoidia bacterium]
MSAIDDIKQRLDIVELASEYVSLQKSGRSFKALCPFHVEKHPSFFVFPERQSWHCFGACGTGGDIFSFIMKKEGLDFGQALRLLAEKTGVTLVATSSQRKETEDKQKDKLFQINETAAEYYHHLLLNTSAGETARNYIARRGLSPQTVERFQLGFSPDSWEALQQYLMTKGYEEAELAAAGLVVEREGGSSYDRFRNRLMFPIRDIQGLVIGFGARALDESLPKYLNSPQTLIFDKSSSLYGIDQAKTAIRKDNLAIIIEGYMDVLTAHQYGWENTVASMGTSVTERQLTILKKLTKKLILALDADTAGEEAVSRSGEMVDKMLPVPPSVYGWVKYEDAHDAEVKIIVLPRDKDPDEVIREDASQWQKVITDAKPMIDFIFDTVIAKVDLGSAKDKSSVVEKLLPLLSEMKDPLRQAHYVERLARLLKIDVRALGDTLRRFRAVEKKRRVNKNFQSLTTLVPISLSSSPLEEYCLALLFQYPELRSEGMRLSPDYFEHSENRELFLKWQQNAELASLKSSLDIALHEHLDSLLAKVFPPTLGESEVEQQQSLNDCIVRLQENFLRSLEANKEELLAIEAETGGVKAQLAMLEEQGVEVSQQLKEVFIKRGHRRQPVARRSE